VAALYVCNDCKHTITTESDESSMPALRLVDKLRFPKQTSICQISNIVFLRRIGPWLSRPKTSHAFSTHNTCIKECLLVMEDLHFRRFLEFLVHGIAAKDSHETCNLLQMPQSILTLLVRQSAHKINVEQVVVFLCLGI